MWLEGETALHLAAQWGFPKLVAILLAAGVDPNIQTALGDTPLRYAAGCGVGPHIGAKVEGREDDPNLKAMRDLAALLLEAGADPRRPDCEGITPLDLAMTVRGHFLLDLVPVGDDEACGGGRVGLRPAPPKASLYV